MLFSSVFYINIHAFRSGVGVGNQDIFYRAIWSDIIKSEAGLNLKYFEYGTSGTGSYYMDLRHDWYLMPVIYTFYENDVIAFNTGVYINWNWDVAVLLPEIEIKPFKNKDIRILSTIGKIQWSGIFRTISLNTIFGDFDVKVCWYF